MSVFLIVHLCIVGILFVTVLSAGLACWEDEGFDEARNLLLCASAIWVVGWVLYAIADYYMGWRT